MLKLTVQYTFTNKTGGTTKVFTNRNARFVYSPSGETPYLVINLTDPKDQTPVFDAIITHARITDQETGKVTMLESSKRMILPRW